MVAGCAEADSAEAPANKSTVNTQAQIVQTSSKTMKLRPFTLNAPAEPSTAKRLKKPKNGPRYAKVSIKRTLEGGFVKAVGSAVGPALAQVVKRALVWWINPRTDLRKGDSIEVVYETPEGLEPLAHAIWFRSSKLEKTMVAVRYKADKNEFPRWFQPDGSELALRLVKGPIRRYEQITSLLMDGRGHKGMDFKAPVGSKIYAPFSGKVVRKNWSRRGNGLCLDIQRPNGQRIYLLHLDRIVPGIRPGSWVKVGQHIAFSGNTGRSTAPHLHYQIEKTQRGRVLDPLKMHKSTRFRLQADEAKRMRHRLSRLNGLRSRSIR